MNLHVRLKANDATNHLAKYIINSSLNEGFEVI